MMTAQFVWSLALALLLIGPAEAHETARATYVGNEGVMVARGETKVLFDAFYADSYDTYLLVPQPISDAMLKGTAPYDGIDAVFVSHVHGDHFSPAPMIAYLRARPQVRLYAPKQVVDVLRESGLPDGDPAMSRVVSIDLQPTDRARTLSVEGIEIDVVAIPHDGNLPDVQNYSWRVTLDGKTTVIHLGDAGTVGSNFERHREHFAARKHDAAFPPYWWFGREAGRAVLDTYIRGRQTIGIHVPADAQGKGDLARAKLGGDVFTDPGETREIAE